MSGNENQRKWKHSEAVTMRLCTCKPQSCLLWECSQLFGVCNVKTSWWEVENSKRKEVLSCRALHPRDDFLSEIVSVLFTISINSGLQWSTWDPALWSHCCYSYHQLMIFVRDTQEMCENCSSYTSCPCCAPAAEPTKGSSPPSQHLGEKETFSYLAALTEDWELKSSQSSTIIAARVTDIRGYLTWTG